eukprot:SAG25_NODE_190_length_12277_cov_10.004927_12_plen_114_part_00
MFCPWAPFVCRGGVIMIVDHRIRRRVGRCGSWLLLADFWGVGGLQPRVARPKSTDSCCFQAPFIHKFPQQGGNTIPPKSLSDSGRHDCDGGQQQQHRTHTACAAAWPAGDLSG